VLIAELNTKASLTKRVTVMELQIVLD